MSEGLDVARASLAPEPMMRLSNASAIALGLPHEQIASTAVRIAGSEAARLDRSILPAA